MVFVPEWQRQKVVSLSTTVVAKDVSIYQLNTVMKVRWELCRLRHPEAFQVLYRQGKRFFSPHWMLISSANSLNHARLGMTVPKKTAKLAVERNRLKRLSREVFRSQQERLPAVDLLFHYRQADKTAQNTSTREELESLCKQLIAYYRKLSSN